MSEEYERLRTCYDSIAAKIPFTPKIGVVLGSGLGDFVDSLTVESVIRYEEIEHFPLTTVPGHEGCFIFAYIDETPVVVMKGRIHYYEGYSMFDVVEPIRLMYLMGARALVLTCASSGINYKFSPGDLMLIEDHISCFVPSPLRGGNIEELGARFPGMEEVYDKELRGILLDSAREFGIHMQRGVFIQLSGPEYETVSEVKMCRSLGADAVGMSTACEAIAARHMGMKVCGIACITNMAVGIMETPLTYTGIREGAHQMLPALTTLLVESIRQMGYMTGM